MKKTFFAFAALAAMFCSACNNEITPATEGEGSITIKVEGIEGITRASDITALAAETAVNKCEVLVFGADQKLVTYKDLGTSLTGTTDKIAKATYTVYAVINGASLNLSTCNTEADLKAKATELTAFNGSNGFVMCGSNTCSVTAENTACAITASRLAARIVLKSVQNTAPAAKGAISVKAIFLSNVNTKNTLDGTGAASAVATDFVNQYGRTEWVFASKISATNAPTSTVAALTYKAETTSVANGATVNFGTSKFAGYCYANSNADASLAATATALPTAFAPCATRLVVLATFDGADYYYPVIVPNVARNTSYDIVLKIADKGLTDPQGDPTVLSEKGSIAATITVAPWVAGQEITADY